MVTSTSGRNHSRSGRNDMGETRYNQLPTRHKENHIFKGQMNQNLNIFSLAILKRRNVKQNIQKETYAEIFLYEP